MRFDARPSGGRFWDERVRRYFERRSRTSPLAAEGKLPPTAPAAPIDWSQLALQLLHW
ncbi:MAG: hypothetical protein KGJ86_08795 [Chloroflexota bacterium]|nr:hypothetical protein [Chloroflexota bacterium]